MRVKRRDAELWMSHRMLPDLLKERIRRYEQYKWQENKGAEEETLIRNLPKDLRRDIKRHLCLELLRKVCIYHPYPSLHSLGVIFQLELEFHKYFSCISLLRIEVSV